MVPKIKSFVNAQGGSLTFSAQGGRVKEKIFKSVEKIGRRSEGAAEGAPHKCFALCGVASGAIGFVQQFLIK